jgi:predicted PurR-regulated permease PerM
VLKERIRQSIGIKMTDLQNEWTIIHGDIERYERFSLLIKLVAVLICVLGIIFHLNFWLALIFILILWLQDGIWTTFQKRLESRVLFIEKNMQKESAGLDQSFQLYSQWNENRAGITSVIREYILNSAKPTVAYPYSVLLALMLVLMLFVSEINI